MTYRKKVALGLCVKNAEATIEDAMNSILNQDFPHRSVELIIVEGCSKDGTFSIIEKCLRARRGPQSHVRPSTPS